MAENTTGRPARASKPSENQYQPIHKRRWFWPVAIGTGIVLIMGFFATLFAVAFGPRHMAFERAGFYGPGGGAMVHGREGRVLNGSRLEDNQSRLRGVVTALSGSTFTVAGNGTTNEVQTNSSTQYQNASQVKVNDTVVVFGSADNGKFTAKQVLVNP